MLPSRTVENYLKEILLAQSALPDPSALVPMGQLASALGVVPGTATTMVKALAESGLVRYEPYAGVRLTPAGQKLAALVLRRHRLIELFLVQVMGMSWAEVHDEAEQLEHAVSDRLIGLIDEMLGRPAVDPHGDPIPGPEGTVHHRSYEDLLTCPIRTPVVVTRVTAQDGEFLRFIENNDLKPGQSIEVEARDPAADSVVVRHDDRRVTMGMRAASKVLVEVLVAVLLLLVGPPPAAAQATAGTGSDRPFEISDNSFLIEEAFNQEPGIFQNIFGVVRISGGWDAAFTQEWPVGTQTHQFSYTVPFAGGLGESGVGDILINYRFQAFTETDTIAAFAPRLSLILPTGDEERGLGSGVPGVQINFPLSKQGGDFYFHWNAGVTVLPGVRFDSRDEDEEGVTLVSPFFGGSVIWRALPMLHPMIEAIVASDEEVEAPGTKGRIASFTLSPGVRGGWNVGDHQVIVGAAIPLVFAEDDTDAGFFGYFSYELPFKR